MNKKRFVQTASVIAAVSLIVSCGTGEKKQAANKVQFDITTTDSYPLNTDAELTWWLSLPDTVAGYAGSMNEIPLKQNLEEATGVKINFIHPPTGQNVEKFNLMIASREFPDMITYNWLTYPGGAQKAIDEDIIIPLNDYMDKVSPNFTKTLNENPDIAKQASTDNGTYFSYPFMLSDDKQATYQGFIIRKDLLEKAGLEEPHTLEQWDKVLRKFKEMGVKTPLAINMTQSSYKAVSPFTGCFGFCANFYVEDGKVKYGPVEPAFTDYVKQLNTWYNDGILDNDFSDFDSKRQTAMVINGEIGATYCKAGGDLGKWLPAIKQNNSDIKYEPIEYMTAKEGERPMVGQKNQRIVDSCVAITTQCKNPEIAMRFLDYGYSDEGHMLYNFGQEGISYNMVDGNPVYTPEILDSQKNGGLSVGQAMSKYLCACYNGPFVQDIRYNEQYMQSPEQKRALNLWSDTDMLKYALPFLSMTEDENKKYNKIMQDVENYEMEMLHKFISGKADLSGIDEYYSTMKSLGIDEAISIKQAAYDRYLKK